MSIIYLILKLLCIWVCSILYRRGGKDQSLYRNPGVGIVMGVTMAVCNGSWIPLLFIPAFWAVIQAFSYGVNAPIHVLWLRIFGYEIRTGNDEAVEFLTRVTCCILWSIPCLLFGMPLWVWAISTMVRAICVGLLTVLSGDVEVEERGTGAFYSSVVLL